MKKSIASIKGILLALGFGLFAILLVLGNLNTVKSVHAASYTVTRNDDPIPDGCAINDCSLREAILAANSAAGLDEITLGNDTYTLSITGTAENASATGDLDISDDLIISGEGANLTIIDGAQIDRVFHITPTANITLSGITIQNGFITNTASIEGETDEGGAVKFEAISDTLTVQNSRFFNNFAANEGGAIHTRGDNTTIRVSHSTFISNSAHENDGGAMDSEGLTVTVTILNSTFRDNFTERDGGAVQVEDDFANVMIRNSIFRNNTAGDEGGAFQADEDDNTITIINTQFISNTALDDGGAVLFDNDSTVMIKNTEFINNHADGGDGGAIHTDDTSQFYTVTIASSTFAGNTATTGGGAINFEGQTLANIEDTTFISNSTGISTTTLGGGALRTETDTTTVRINRSAFVSNQDNGQNTVNGGGAILIEDPETTFSIANTTLSGNGSTLNGGAISAQGLTTVTLTLNNVTIADNTADSDNNGSGDGGGIWILEDPSNELNVANTIVASNSDNGGEAPDCVGGTSIISSGYNLVGDSSGCGWTPGPDDQVGTGIMVLDPGLDPLTGSPPFHPLANGSLAIDAGNPAAPGGAFPACAATDQRNLERPLDNRCDSGAFESDALILLYLPVIFR